jgi:hypothetical protein
MMWPTTIVGNGATVQEVSPKDSPDASATNPHTIQNNNKTSNGMPFASLHFRKTPGGHHQNHHAPSRNKHFSCRPKGKEDESHTCAKW